MTLRCVLEDSASPSLSQGGNGEAFEGMPLFLTPEECGNSFR